MFLPRINLNTSEILQNYVLNKLLLNLLHYVFTLIYILQFMFC
jgi:hypothetical protein